VLLPERSGSAAAAQRSASERAAAHLRSGEPKAEASQRGKEKAKSKKESQIETESESAQIGGEKIFADFLCTIMRLFQRPSDWKDARKDQLQFQIHFHTFGLQRNGPRSCRKSPFPPLDLSSGQQHSNTMASSKLSRPAYRLSLSVCSHCISAPALSPPSRQAELPRPALVLRLELL